MPPLITQYNKSGIKAMNSRFSIYVENTNQNITSIFSKKKFFSDQDMPRWTTLDKTMFSILEHHAYCARTGGIMITPFKIFLDATLH